MTSKRVKERCIIIIIIIIQFNSCLFTCKLNSTEANYKVSTSTYKYTKIIKRTKHKIIIIITSVQCWGYLTSSAHQLYRLRRRSDCWLFYSNPNHTQLFLTLLHVTLSTRNYLCRLFYTISVDYRLLTVDYFCWRWSIDSRRWPLDCWLSYFDFLFCDFLWLPSAESESESYVTTDGQSASLSWYKAPIRGLRPDFFSVRKME
jgi:hypothetical protein